MRSWACLRVILDGKRWNIQELNALWSSVVKVDVCEPDAAKLLCLDNRSNTPCGPLAEVVKVLGDSTGLLCNKLAQTWENQTVIVVLSSNLNLAGQKIHDWFVTAMVAKFEFLDICTGNNGEHLVAQADTKDGNLAQNAASGLLRSVNLLWVTRAVGEEDAVWVVG